MRKSLLLCPLVGLFFACAATGASRGTAPGEEEHPSVAPAEVETAADKAPQQAALDRFIERLDRKAAAIRTLQADLTITNYYTFSGRKSVRSGGIYIRKPSDIFLDLKKDYPRKVWLTGSEIVDYNPDLGTAVKVELAKDGKKPEIIGLSTGFAELGNRFILTLDEPSGEKPACRILTLVPKPDVKADFTSTQLYIDAETLLPVKIVQKDSELDLVKTWGLSNIKENPRLPARLFKPRLARGTDVTVKKLGKWDGP